MVIDFDNEEYASFPKFKGGEGEMLSKMHYDGLNRIMKAKLEPGASIGLHTHEGNSEIIYILSGEGCVLYDGERLPLKAGQCHYCPKGHSHSLINDSKDVLEFFAAVPEQP